MVLPSLAKAIGLNEAIVLQQVHYLLTISSNERDGCMWVYNSIPAWHRDYFYFLSFRSVERAFSSLEKLGLLVSTSQYNKMAIDRTKWYRINYDGLEKVSADAYRQNGGMVTPNCGDGHAKMADSIPPNCGDGYRQNSGSNNHETTTETTTKTTDIDNASADASVYAPVKAKKQNRKAEAIALLVANGVSEQIANDFMAVRTSKRAGTLTETAMNGIATQAAKAGLTVEQAVTVCIDRNWVGFNADWIKPTHTRVNKTDSSWLLLKSRKEAVVAWDEAKREALVTRRNHESADWKEPQWMPVPDVNLLNQIRQHFAEAA